MRMRSTLLSVIAASILLSGCGAPPPPPMDKALYDKVMMAQFDLLLKGKATKADIDKLYQKNGTTREVIAEAQKLWGEPEAVQKKRMEMLEKMTVGAK